MSILSKNLPTIALLTDFGLEDIYVGVMKGVMWGINPDLKFLDLTHNLPRQNILAGRFALMNAVNYLPKSTIYLVVVDPTVGSSRRAIAVDCECGYVIAPDNGILEGLLSIYPAKQIYWLNNDHFWLTHNPSNTFHGRDIFAPIAAHLANGIKLTDLGEEINPNSLQKINLPSYKIVGNTITGFIQYIDIYGNLITNIPAHILEKKSWFLVENKVKILQGKTYSDVNESELVALIGSHGWLEVAVNGGSAKEKLNKKYLDLIQVFFE